MRVLLLLQNYNDDLRGTMVYRLCQRLSPLRELSLTAVSLGGGGPLQKAFSSIGVGTMTIPPEKAGDHRFLRSEAGRLFHRRDRPDIVYSHCPWPAAAVRAFHHGDERIPLILRVHDIRELDSRGGISGMVSGFLERRTRRHVSVCLANSRAMVARMRVIGIPETQIRLIPFGIDAVQCFPLSPASRARFRSVMGVPDGVPLLLAASDFIPENGFADLIEAMPAILRDHPKTVLFIIGEGPERGTMTGRIASLGITESVRLIRPLPEILPRLMSTADVVIHPVRTASNPTIVQKAAASGTATVATRIGPSPEVLRDGETGLLVEPGSVEGLARAISRLLADPGERQLLGSAAREFMLENYELGRTADQLIELWRTLAPDAAWQATDTIPLDALQNVEADSPPGRSAGAGQ